MDRHSWVVSNPPHLDANHDEAAALLGITIAEFRIKANFSAPEVWLAYPEADAAAEAAKTLTDVGLNVLVVPGPHLARIPWPESMGSFSFEDDRFVAIFEEETVELPYDIPIIGVFCKPPGEVGTGSFGSASSRVGGRRAVGLSKLEKRLGGTQDPGAFKKAKSLDSSTNLDLYVSLDQTLRRITIAQAVIQFSGLGTDLRPRATDNMAACVEMVEQRFTNLWVDRRLVGVRPRQGFVIDGKPAGHPSRRLFSFGTLGLRELITSAAPDLGEITQFELGSRLAYLMRRQVDAASAWVE